MDMRRLPHRLSLITGRLHHKPNSYNVLALLGLER